MNAILYRSDQLKENVVLGKIMGHLLMGLLVMFIMLALYAIIFAPSAREVAMGKPCVQALHAHYESNGVEEEQVIAGYDIAKIGRAHV